LTTKSAVPSLEIASDLAAFPVLTEPKDLLLTRSQAVTFPAIFKVTYNLVLSGDKTTARGFTPIGINFFEKSVKSIW